MALAFTHIPPPARLATGLTPWYNTPVSVPARGSAYPAEPNSLSIALCIGYRVRAVAGIGTLTGGS